MHVYVWTPLGEQKVRAYPAICPTEVARNDTASRIDGRRLFPHYRNTSFPAW